MDPHGRSAIVTGGAGGLGGATVRRLAEVGYGVVVFDRAADAAEALAAEVGDQARAASGDDLTASVVFPERMGHPEEFALLVESIAANPYLNGETIRLDGALRFPPK